MAEPSYPVAVVSPDSVALSGLQRALAELGPVWPCPRAQDLGALVGKRRIRVVISTPRDSRGALVADALSTLARHAPSVAIVLLYSPSVPDLADARAVAETGASIAHLLLPARDLPLTIRSVLSPRWRRGPECLLLRGLVRHLAGAAEPFGALSVLRPWAAAKVGDLCELSGLHQRRVERDFARSLPQGGLVGPMTPQRFARLSLALTVAWWLTQGRTVDQLAVQFGFVHRYALAGQVKKYAGRPPGGFARPRDFREAYASVIRRFLPP
jgi:hypothetical protein